MGDGMAGAASDLDDFLAVARTNDPRIVQALGERLPKAKLHVPLARSEGVRNRPETAVELGAELPIHWLRLDNGETAVPIFTSLALCRGCAAKLGWTTDDRAIRSLALPGAVALELLAKVLVAPGVERAVVNPLGDSELHLARTEVEALAAQQPLRALWFYTRNGALKRPVEIEGASLLGTLLSRTDRLLDALGGPARPPLPLPFPEASDALEHLESASPLGALASKLYRIVSLEDAGPLELTVTRRRGDVSVEASPAPSPELLRRLRDAAREALEGASGDVKLTFRIDGASIVLSSSGAPASEAPPPRPPVPRLDYIPLEPEDGEG